MFDDEFLDRFESAGFSAAEFPHRSHLRMAWLYVTRLGAEAAAERAVTGIRHLADAHGHQPRYHETMTRAWVRIVALAVEQHPGAGFEELLARHPMLLDRHLLLRHYSAEHLFSPQARQTWVEPDLAPIPAGGRGMPFSGG